MTDLIHNSKHNSNFDSHENVETLVPLLKLEVEDGSSETSLKNVKLLIEAYGQPNYVRLVYDTKGGYTTIIGWTLKKGSYSRPFWGFAWGYRGEGPHGLLKFFELARIPGHTIEEICSFPQHIDRVIYCSEMGQEIKPIEKEVEHEDDKPIRTLHRPPTSEPELSPEGSDLIRDTFGE